MYAGLSEENIVIEPTYVGGDYGGKGSPLNVPLTYFLSRLAGRPVRMVMDSVAERTAAPVLRVRDLGQDERRLNRCESPAGNDVDEGGG